MKRFKSLLVQVGTIVMFTAFIVPAALISATRVVAAPPAQGGCTTCPPGQHPYKFACQDDKKFIWACPGGAPSSSAGSGSTETGGSSGSNQQQTTTQQQGTTQQQSTQQTQSQQTTQQGAATGDGGHCVQRPYDGAWVSTATGRECTPGSTGTSGSTQQTTTQQNTESSGQRIFVTGVPPLTPVPVQPTATSRAQSPILDPVPAALGKWVDYFTQQDGGGYPMLADSYFRSSVWIPLVGTVYAPCWQGIGEVPEGARCNTYAYYCLADTGGTYISKGKRCSSLNPGYYAIP